MKKWNLFLIILMIAALFAFFPAAAIADETAQSRAGPILIITANVQHCGVTEIAIAKALIATPNGVWAQTANAESNLSLKELTNEAITLIELPVVTIIVSTDTHGLLKLPLADSIRKSSHLTIVTSANHGRIFYHYRA